MKSKSFKIIMAYVTMPLFFSLLGVGLIILISFPVLRTIFTIGSVVTSPNNNATEISSVIYDENVASEVEAVLEADNIEEIPLADVTVPANSTQYGYISCERIGLSAPLYLGDDANILRKGIGQYLGSSMPGFGKPILACGHNTTYCLPLQYITEGDIISISTNYGLYEYQVSAVEVHHMTDGSAFDLSKDEEQLILYTCYPFNLIGHKVNRLFIYANKISGADIIY